MPKNKIKVGDRYLIEMKVTKVSDDGDRVTVLWPAYGTPQTVTARALDDEEKVSDA